MNSIDRFNIQRKKSNNQLHNSMLDNYILARIKGRLIIDEKNYHDTIDSIAADIIKTTDKILKDS